MKWRLMFLFLAGLMGLILGGCVSVPPTCTSTVRWPDGSVMFPPACQAARLLAPTGAAVVPTFDAFFYLIPPGSVQVPAAAPTLVPTGGPQTAPR